jgi:hypothetical protein
MSELQGVEADLAVRVAALFQRCPMLCGFSVRDASSEDVVLVELSCHPALDREQCLVLSEAISCALLDLVDELPEAAALLPGRTFARALH